MPIRSEILPDKNLLLNVVEGPLTASEVLAGYVGVREIPGFELGMNILWDMREASTRGFSGNDMRRIETRIRNSPHVDSVPHKIAFVAGSDAIYGFARMYQSLADGQDVEIEVFRSMDDALHWVNGVNSP